MNINIKEYDLSNQGYSEYVQLYTDFYKSNGLDTSYEYNYHNLLYPYSYLLSDLNKSGRFISINDVPLVLYDDYFDRSKRVIVPVLSNYGIYSLHEKFFYDNTIEGYGLSHTDFPVLSVDKLKQTYKTPREFVAKGISNNFIPHVFGEKSYKIAWNVCWGKRAYNICSLVKADILEQQKDSILSKEQNQVERFFANEMPIFWYNQKDIPDSFGCVYAIDSLSLFNDKIICCMMIYLINKVLCASLIAFSHEDKYRPYSLASMAHLMCVLYALNHFGPTPEISHVDLGINFSPLGNYKHIFRYNTVESPMWITQ